MKFKMVVAFDNSSPMIDSGIFQDLKDLLIDLGQLTGGEIIEASVDTEGISPGYYPEVVDLLKPETCTTADGVALVR